jgi:ethanolaminephosphotransferase
MVPKSTSSANTEFEDGLNGQEKAGGDDHGGFYYLSPEARRILPHYQYKGCDNSLMYKYMLSPLAAFCVNRLTPKTLAPNTITLSGLILMIVSYSIFWYYVPTLEIDQDEPPPRWIFLFNCIAMLVYQTLDNMDGKQARKTNSSSPLGLLFDHGCDAINSIFGSANWIISMGLVPSQDPLLCWIVIFGPFCMFYIATWEEYYTGELIMPIVNGPNEGLVGGAMLSLASYVLGYSFWHRTDWYDSMLSILPASLSSILEVYSFRNCDLLVMAAAVGFAQEIVLKSIFVTGKYGARSLANLIPFAALSLGFLVIGIVQPDIWLRIPRTSLHLSMILFVEMSTQIMLAHITEQQFNPWRWHLLPLVGLILVVSFGMLEPGSVTDDWLLAYASGIGVYLTMKIVVVIHEICAVFNIWCFDIVTPRVGNTKGLTNGHSKRE